VFLSIAGPITVRAAASDMRENKRGGGKGRDSRVFIIRIVLDDGEAFLARGLQVKSCLAVRVEKHSIVEVPGNRSDQWGMREEKED
jgi:hypothetical protein